MCDAGLSATAELLVKFGGPVISLERVRFGTSDLVSRLICMSISTCMMDYPEVRGATRAEKLRGTEVWVPTPGRLCPAPGHRPGWEWVQEKVAPCRCRGPGITRENFFENSDAKSCILVTTSHQNYWLLHILVGSLGCVYPIKQLACQWLSQFQNFNFAAMVAPLVVRTKKQSSRNCEIMLWNFLLFENYGQEVGGLIHCWSPQPKRLVTLFDL